MTGGTVAELLDWGAERLRLATRDSSGREAAWLLARVTGTSEAHLRGHGERTVDARDATTFSEWIRRRAAGEPFAYITGQREFYGREFRVNPQVLIPRPETEHVVELSLSVTLPSAPRILDLGTGSGVLAVTLALEFGDSRIVAVDRSIAALAVAAANCRRFRVTDRTTLVAGHWNRALGSEFDLVVANPPYLTAEEWLATSAEVREHEPPQALVAGEHGLDAYLELEQGLGRLRRGAVAILEIGAGQATQITKILGNRLENMAIHRDLAGRNRLVIGTTR